MNRVILQSGVRTGSHLILDAYVSNGYRSFHADTHKYNKEYKSVSAIRRDLPSIKESVKYYDTDEANTVLHSHVGYVPINCEEYDLVVSRRRNKLDQILSFLVARERAEWVIDKYHNDTNAIVTKPISKNDYGKYTITKDKIDHAVSVLLKLVVLQNIMMKEYKWKSVSVLFLEDIIKNGPIWMHNHLGLPYQHGKFIWGQQTHYKPKDVLNNYSAIVDYINFSLNKENRRVGLVTKI